MANRQFKPGEHGEIDLTPLKKVDGKWRRQPNGKGAEQWRARVRYRGHDGVYSEVSARGATRVAARAAAESALQRRLSGGVADISPTTPFVTVGESWLRSIQRLDRGLSNRTIRDYTGSFRRHVAGPSSSLMGLSVQEANNVNRIKTFLQGVADASGTGAAKTAKSVVSGVLNHAVDSNAIALNAARTIKPARSQQPKAAKRDKRRSFTSWELANVLQHADKIAASHELDPRSARKWQSVADLVALMAGTGARIGEARAVRWEHLVLNEDDCESHIRLHGTKTKSARRRVDLPPSVSRRLRLRVDHLRFHVDRALLLPKATQTESVDEVVERLTAFRAALGEEGFVFAAPAVFDQKRPWNADNSNKAVRAVLDGAGCEWAVPHTFRRTVATRLDEAGQSLRSIADLLGHEDPAMTASVYLGRDFEGNKSNLALLLEL